MLSVVLAGVLVMPGTVIGQVGERVGETVMSRDARTEQAQRALAEGDYALAIAQADALLERWPRDEDGLILKAAALLFGPEVDANEASRLLRRLPRSRRKEADVEALDLWKDYRHGFNFMPTVREKLQMGRARDLLEQDAMDPIANLVAGMLRVEDQRALDNAARLGVGTGAGDIISLISYDAEAIIDSETGRIRFVNRRTAAPDVQITWNDEPMRQASEEAVRFLIRATASGPMNAVAARYLVEAAIRGGRVRDAELLMNEYVSRHPDTMRGHLYLGLVQYMLQKDSLSEASFEQALALMPEDRQRPWLHPESVVSTNDRDDYRMVDGSGMRDFWARQDREWGTSGNERKLEHMGRMAYADIIWGREENDFRGWETEPGQLIVRYGFPLARVQFQNEFSRFHILHYGDRYWFFDDMAKTGEPIFYSPPADTYQGGRAVMVNDWALMAKEQFRDNPLKSDLDETGKMDMVLAPSVFEAFDPDGGHPGSARTVITPICIRGAAFPAGTDVRVFDRAVGAPIPPPADSVQVLRNGTCPSALAIHDTDGRARQVSIEVRRLGFWSVGRFDVPLAAAATELRTSDILLADLIVEHDPADTVPPDMLVRNDLLIHPVAEPRYDRGSPIFVYAEAYGLDEREGDMLTIQAILAEGSNEDMAPSLLGRLFGGRDEAAVSVSFEDEIRFKSHGRYLILETEDLDQGSYTLALRFTERATGRQAVVRREIRID